MQGQSLDFRSRLEEMLETYGLPRIIADDVEHLSIQVTYEKGAVIFLRGAASDLLFWLIKGFVKLYLPLTNGDRILVDLARPGDLMGAVNDLDSKGHRHLLEAHALTKCTVGLFTETR